MSKENLMSKKEEKINEKNQNKISPEELVFRIEHFKYNITAKNVIPLKELLSNSFRFDTTDHVIQSKLWWLYKTWDRVKIRIFNRLIDGFNFWDKKIFTQEEVYKILFLNVVLPYKIKLLEQKDPKGLNQKEVFNSKFNNAKREANKYAINNARNQWLFYQMKDDLLEDDENIKEFYFEDGFENRVFQKIEAFNPFERIVKVSFQDEIDCNNFQNLDWILAFDMGGGWYLPMTKFNSYKYLY